MADPVPWVYPAGGDYTERLDWLTDVQPAANGYTQHRRLRQSPRVTLGFTALAEGHQRRRLEAQLRGYSGRRWRVPVLVDACLLGVAADVGDTELVLDASASRFVAGGYLLLRFDDQPAAEVAQIAAGGVSSGGLTLEAELARSWPAGTLVTPLRTARLAEFPELEHFTGDASALSLSWTLTEPLDDEAAIVGDTYRGFPVWPFAPVWNSGPAWSPERVQQGVDDGLAAPVLHDLAGVPQGRVRMQYAVDTRAQVLAFRAALFALAGRWSPAWIVNSALDARVVANVSNGAGSIDVEGPLLADTGLFDNQRDIRLHLRDGTVLDRRITALATPSAGVERWTLDAVISTGFAAADVLRMSFLTLCVQDADTNLLRYWTRDVMECELGWRQLVHGL